MNRHPNPTLTVSLYTKQRTPTLVTVTVTVSVNIGVINNYLFSNIVKFDGKMSSFDSSQML